MNKISMQDAYENAQEGDMDLNNKIRKLGELNKLTYEDLILSMWHLDWIGMKRVQIF